MALRGRGANRHRHRTASVLTIGRLALFALLSVLAAKPVTAADPGQPTVIAAPSTMPAPTPAATSIMPAVAGDVLPATQLSIAPAQEAARSHEAAQALLAQGRLDEALAAIEHGLQRVPGDLRLQFQRGVVLARVDRTDEAIAAFVGLTRRFPELPEPYNNLATLHAQQGDLDRAEQALHEALRALPTYSLAHENLGDLQLRLAERSYRRAVQADDTNVSARERLARVQALITATDSERERPEYGRTWSDEGKDQLQRDRPLPD